MSRCLLPILLLSVSVRSEGLQREKKEREGQLPVRCRAPFSMSPSCSAAEAIAPRSMVSIVGDVLSVAEERSDEVRGL